MNNLLINQKGTVFGCFSPLVMIITFIIEISFAAFLLWQHREKFWGKLVALILICLAIFQLAEYQVCGGAEPLTWARIGYISITLLPPLGITLAHIIANKPLNTWLHRLAWISGAYFVFVYAFSPVSAIAPVCTGNYVIFEYDYLYTSGYLYAMYYFGLLFATMFAAHAWTKNVDEPTKKSAYGLVIGYSAFIVPTMIANLVNPETIDGIPSIMCGFAVLWALVLLFVITPQLAKREENSIEKIK